MSFTKIIDLQNEIEADLLSAILDDRHIPHVVRRHANPALEGFFQNRFGWGRLEADEKDAAAIREAYADLRAAPAPTDGDPEAEDGNAH